MTKIDPARQRGMLPVALLDEFAAWLALDGFTRREPTNHYEAMRMRHDGKRRTIIAYRKNTAHVHVTVMGRDVATVRRFLRERRQLRQPTATRAAQRGGSDAAPPASRKG